jgi:predicted nucleic acid-binding protein
MERRMRSYMFDTNVFNHLLDGMAELSTFVGRANFYATHVQIDELNRTRDEGRKAALLQVFEEVTSVRVPTESFVLDASRLDEAKLGGEHVVPTESAVWGVSKWGQCKWTSIDNLYDPMKSKLDQLNKNKSNNIQDSLIAETAIKNRFTLVTHDSDLFKVATDFGGACANIHQLIKELSLDAYG